MLSSISPFGERARASRWWITTTSYLLASLVGGLVMGLLAAAVGSLIPAGVRAHPVTLVVLAALFLVGVVLDRRGWRAIPSWRRQVNENWLTAYRGWVYGAGFGAQLGFGLVTIVTSTTTYAVVLAAVLTGTWWAGAVIGGVFGVVRALPALALAQVATRQQLHAVFARIESSRTRASLCARFALMVGAAASVAAAGMAATAKGLG